MIQSHLSVPEPPIIAVTFEGRIDLAEINASREFGDVIKSLQGKPFRVLCDFTRTITMPEAVSEVFMRAQEFAVTRGMERDAFVCSSSVLRLQFSRIAKQSGRLESLGPLRFFDTVLAAKAFLLE
jgi:hypothetical protein